MASSGRRRWLWALVGVTGCGLGACLAVYLFTESRWYASLGYGGVFRTILVTRAVLFLAGAVGSWLLLHGNYVFSRRAPLPSWAAADSTDLTFGLLVWRLIPTLLIASALAIGWLCSREWQTLLGAIYAQPAGQTDPVFGRDLSFYLLQLPLWSALQKYGLILAIAAWAALYLRYAELPKLGDENQTIDVSRMALPGRQHLSALAAVVVLLWAWGFWLTRFKLLLSARSGVVHGVGYADAHFRLPLLVGLTVVTLAIAVALALNARGGNLGRMLVLVAVVTLAAGLGSAAPALYQRLIVAPNEITLEKPYIQRCIAATRAALALDRVEVREDDVAPALTPSEQSSDRDVLAAVPVWSGHELSEQLVATEALRTYYSFNVVDYDRYRLDGRPRQTGLMVREMQTDRLDPGSQTWVNRHLVFTHGYGLAMAAADGTGPGGSPLKLISGLPPQTPPELPLTTPQIYYGETPADYAVTGLPGGARTRELDYAAGDGNAYGAYAGQGGLLLGGRLSRLAWALRLQSLNLFISRMVENTSRLHWRRELSERLSTLAPFLDFDSDPYPVVADGRVRWIADACTVSGRYPYAWPQPLYYARALTADQPEQYSRLACNYIRNSVKAVVDAYDGSVKLHLIDPTCPLARTWERVFPSLFTREPLPAGLREHVRYPQDLFVLQARAMARFHMTDPNVFYSGEDLWDLAREETTVRQPDSFGRYSFAQVQERMLPYYLLMRLPDEAEAHFRLVVPFTPAASREAQTSRENLVAWMAADCDPEHYGRLRLIQFPKGRLVYGPLQIEAMINQEPAISAQLTLWGQQGSRVLRGRLLILPVGRTLIYVEPLYLTAEQRGALPELKRIVVYTNGRVAMGETLAEAFAAAMAGRATTSTADSAETLRLRHAVDEASRAWQEAESARRRGDLTAYGEALKRVERALGTGAR